MERLNKSIVGGMSISIGAYAYLIVLNRSGNQLLAACVFYIGLALILTLGTNLFTGRVFTDVGTDSYFKNLSIYWIGNLIGSIITVLLLNQIYPLDVTKLITNKMNMDMLQMFISSIFCNILVCSAVKSYRDTKNHLYSWFFITIFVIFGFEHIVANFTYYTIATLNGMFNIKMILALVIVTLGNYAGGRFIFSIIK